MARPQAIIIPPHHDISIEKFRCGFRAFRNNIAMGSIMKTVIVSSKLLRAVGEKGLDRHQTM